MILRTIKTRRFMPPKDDLQSIIDAIPKLVEESVVAISSKVVSICEGNTISMNEISHEDLVKRLADSSLEPIRRGKNDMILTQVGNILVESAGVDESNANGYYILLPKDPYATAESVWKILRKRDSIKKLGIVITDSHSVPRRKGAIGFGIAAYGFLPVNLYDNDKDIFGRSFRFTAADVVDSIAAIATLEMGEGNESTPISVMNEFTHVHFYSKKVSLLQAKRYSWVNPNLDVYSPLLKSELWN